MVSGVTPMLAMRSRVRARMGLILGDREEFIWWANPSSLLPSWPTARWPQMNMRAVRQIARTPLRFECEPIDRSPIHLPVFRNIDVFPRRHLVSRPSPTASIEQPAKCSPDRRRLPSYYGGD